MVLLQNKGPFIFNLNPDIPTCSRIRFGINFARQGLIENGVMNGNRYDTDHDKVENELQDAAEDAWLWELGLAGVTRMATGVFLHNYGTTLGWAKLTTVIPNGGLEFHNQNLASRICDWETGQSVFSQQTVNFFVRQQVEIPCRPFRM